MLFLTLADDMSVPVKGDSEIRIAGANSILPKEHGSQSFSLPIVKYCEKEVSFFCYLLISSIKCF